MKIIDSIKDPKIVLARELSTAKGRINNNACLLIGKEQIFESGYIKIENLKDEKAIILLPAGHELIAKLWPITQKAEDEILENFTTEEKNSLKTLLSKIQDNCYKNLGEKSIK